MNYGVSLMDMQDPRMMQMRLQYLQMIGALPPQNMWDQMPMMLAAGGASGQTEHALRVDPDLGGTGGYPAQAGGTSPFDLLKALGRDPTRRVTQQEYDQMLLEQKRKQDEAYQRYKSKK